MLISDMDSFAKPGSITMNRGSGDNSPQHYIKFRVSDKETMASLQLAASTIMTSRNELPSLISKPVVSIEDNSKELHQVFGSFIHLETDRRN